MTGRKPTKTAISKLAIAAGIIVLLSTALLGFGFSRAISDSMQWKQTMEDSVVNPTFFETDPTRCKTVPDFVLTDRYHKQVKLSDFAAVDTLLVNIWSTGCPVCEQEIPSLDEMDRRIGNTPKVALLTITTDETWQDVAHLFPRGTNLRIFYDPEQKITKDIFGTTRYPETFVLDKQRRIRARFDGEREWHSEELINFITSFQ
jgi:peroxiredoxin